MSLSERQWRGALKVIEQFSAVPQQQRLRQAAGEELLQLLDADYFASYIWDTSSRSFQDSCFINLSPTNLQRYEQHYQYCDPITPQLQSSTRAISVNSVLQQSELMKTEFYNDFLAEDGLYYGVNLYVFDADDNNLADFRIWRKRGKSNFCQDDLQLLDLIAPHYRNTMRTLIRPDFEQQLAEFQLTPREKQVLTLLKQGLRDKHIADKLCISLATCRTHTRHIYEKLQVKGRAELHQFLQTRA